MQVPDSIQAKLARGTRAAHATYLARVETRGRGARRAHRVRVCSPAASTDVQFTGLSSLHGSPIRARAEIPW